jgi:transposase
VIPPEHNAQFVWRMEEILDLYEEPYDPNRPVVCFDERPCQLLADVRDPLPMQPAEWPKKRIDPEYERRGMANVLMAFEPLKGRREMRVTEHRRKLEFADMMRYLLDDLYPEVERIRLVVDNLNTHSPAAFYENFSAEEARRMSKKIEFVYTPKHGSWLNMVEIELSVLVRQCLKRRVPDKQTLEREAGAWCEERNRLGTSVEWRFTTADARIKLRKLYPSIDD